MKRVAVLSITLTLLSFVWAVAADKRGLIISPNDFNHAGGKLGAYKALIIGINEYADKAIPNLNTAANDAREMEKVLRERYGFQTEMLLDRQATLRAINDSLRRISAKASENDSLLIYFAGHGDLDRQYGDGWWVPADAKGGDILTYLDNIHVQRAMANTNARHVLLISDSCYSGTLFGTARALPPAITNQYYLSMYNKKSRWGMTSGNKTPVSDYGSGGHSVFAYQLLKELRGNTKPFISAQEIYTRIAPIIGNNADQTPLCLPVRNTGDQGGNFVFVSAVGAPAKQENPSKSEVNESFSYDPEQLLSSDPARFPFTIQVAAVKERDIAEKVLQTLKYYYETAYIIKKQLADGSIWYRVRVGSFMNRQAAEPVMAALRKQEYSPLLVKR